MYGEVWKTKMERGSFRSTLISSMFRIDTGLKFAISDVTKKKSQLLEEQALPFFFLISCCLDE